MTEPDRIPPNALQAEAVCIGSIVINPTCIETVRKIVQPADMYRPAHEGLLALLLEMHDAGDPLDIVTIVSEIERRKLDVEIDYVVGLIEGTPSAANAPYYAGVVRDCSIRRQLISFGQQTAADGFGQQTAAEQVADAQAKLLDLERRLCSQYEAASDAGEGIGRLVTELQARLDGQRVPNSPMSTGFLAQDGFQDGGPRRGELIVVAADTGVGKSTLAANWAAQWCRDEHAGLLWSTEMLDGECWGRIVSSLTGVPYSLIRSGTVRSENDWRELHAVAETAQAWRWRVVGRPGTIGDVTHTARTCSQRWRRPVDFIVVDFLQDMVPRDPKAHRAEQVGCMARDCKRMAQEIGAVVVLVSQLNREGKVGRPTKRDLRDSGMIEDSADTIVLMAADQDDSSMVWCRFAKNRNGPQSKWDERLRLHRCGPLFRFEQAL